MDNNLYLFSAEEKAEIARHVAKYPEKRSAIMPSLWIAQEKFGWLCEEAMKLVAEEIGVPYAHVYGVASFYTMYLKKKLPKYLLDVCTCFTCGECEGKEVFDHARSFLKTDAQGFSEDGLFYIREAECLAACDTAPVMQVNNRRIVHNLNNDKMENLIQEMRAGKMPDFVPVPPISQTQFAVSGSSARVENVRSEEDAHND